MPKSEQAADELRRLAEVHEGLAEEYRSLAAKVEAGEITATPLLERLRLLEERAYS